MFWVRLSLSGPGRADVPQGTWVLPGVLPRRCGFSRGVPCACKIPVCTVFPLSPARWQAVAMDGAGCAAELCLPLGVGDRSVPCGREGKVCSAQHRLLLCSLLLRTWSRPSGHAALALLLVRRAGGFRRPVVVCAGNLGGSTFPGAHSGAQSPQGPLHTCRLAVTCPAPNAERGSGVLAPWPRITGGTRGKPGCVPKGALGLSARTGVVQGSDRPPPEIPFSCASLP